MQLVAYGAQDIYLTGNPQITFFKVVYRRHTNFSMECIQQTLSGTSTLTSSNASGTVTVSRNGDLLSKVYVRVDANDGTDCISGDQLIKDVTLEIGGQQIDKHTREWLQVWAELTVPDSKAAGYKYLTGGFNNTLMTGGTTGGHSQQSVMVPLQFWFCRNPGLALPLIALQYHEVKMKFTWGTTTEVSRDGSAYGTAPSAEVWCDYIYLDTDERRRFAQVSHEYLIEQLQYQNEGSAAAKYKLNFNHPVKELVWTGADSVTTEKAKLTLNGHDRLAEQDREYYQVRQPLDHHTAVPGFNIKEGENVVMLAQPDRIFDGDHDATAADGSATLAATSVTFHADQATGGTDPAVRCKVGDILFINYSDVGGGTQPNHKRYYVTVTGLTATVITFTAYVDGSAAAMTSADEATFAVTDQDDLSITIVGRIQNPQSRCSQLSRNVNVYSFALKPEEHQPSGTCNFSRIDSAHLTYSSSVTVDNIYAVNYNVLRVMSGMGGLAYSN